MVILGTEYINGINMTKKQIIWILMLCPVFGFGQIVNEVNMNLGFNGNSYKIIDKTGFSNTTYSSDLSLFIEVNARKYLNKQFSYSVGIGLCKEFLGFDPFINIGEINRNELSNFGKLTVAEVANWDWQLQIPISISFELFGQSDNLPIILPGMRLTAGLINKITFNRINTDNIILSEFDELKGYGYEYYDENLNNFISNYYSEQIKHYRLMMNLGIEFFSKVNTIGFLGGMKYNRHLTSPINSEIKNNFSMIGYIGIYYEIN